MDVTFWESTLNIAGFFWTAVISFLFILMTKNSENNAGCMLARKWQMNPGMNAELLSTSLTKLLYSVHCIFNPLYTNFYQSAKLLTRGQ